jgi:hypothetical protein
MPTGRFLLLFIAATAVCHAQSGFAELRGSVSDPTNESIEGARVEAQELATSAVYQVTTNERGEYHFLSLPTGSYALTVAKPGFRDYRQTGITLRLGDQPNIEVKLELGEAAFSIDVQANAPLLNTSTGTVSTNLPERNIVTLPLDGRIFIPLVALSPGVALPNGSLLPRINGSRPRTNEYTFDGVSALQPEPGQVVFYPIIDGMQEFKLNINSYSPEYGRSNGGTVMVATKSGSNQLHGSLFDFFRNEALNARNYFAPSGPKPEFRRNQYGVVLGGPIQKNETFLFVAWQGTRLRTGVTRVSTVPTLQQRQGVFTNPIYDPTTPDRAQFPNNTIPQSSFDPLGTQVMNRYPVPNRAGTANNYARTGVEPENADQFDVRLDRYFGSRQRVFGRYSLLRDEDTPVTPLPEGSGVISSGVISATQTGGNQVVAEYDLTLSPTAVNQARFGYTWRTSVGSTVQNGTIPVPGIPENGFTMVMPTFTATGMQQIGPPAGANSNFATSVTEYMDNFTKLLGRHTFKFGVDIRREALNVLAPPNPKGLYGFTVTGTNKSGVSNSGNGVASLLLGQVNNFSIDVQPNELQERANIAEFYAGNEWRISRNVSVNVGTRYTLNFPSTEVNNYGSVFNLNTQVLDFVHTARNLEGTNFGPRAGIAFQANDSIVIRAGYGMIWFEQTGITSPFTLPQFPFVQTVGQQSQDGINAAFTLGQGPSVVVTLPNPNSGLGQGVFGTQRDNGSGYSQQWNFTIQKTFGPNISIDMGYLGSKNTRLGIPEANLNQLQPSYFNLGSALLRKVPNPYYGQIPPSSSIGGPTVAAQQLLRAYPRFTTVALFRDNVGNSTYHAFQVSAQKRFSRGLTFTFAYTFSKLIDDASSYFSQTIFTGPVLNNTGAADAFNRHLEKDVSSGDIPNVFSASWTYNIPKVWKISGWQIAGIVRAQSGDAVPVTQATNFDASLGFAVQRPNRNSNPNGFSGRSAGQWFNTAAFTQAPQFTIGNSSRNPVRGPSLQDVSMMLGKTFTFTERLALEFRAEVFNMTNTPPLNDPNGSYGSPAFGTITSAGNPRVFELALKLHF